MKGVYRRIVAIAVLLVLSILFNVYLNTGTASVNTYVRHVFLPIQKFKDSLFNSISFSIGDFLYLLLGFYLLTFIVRLIFLAITFVRNKLDFFKTLLSTVIFGLAVYLMFLVSWGGNYYRPELAKQWGPSVGENWDTTALVQLNFFLVKKLNILAASPLHFPKLKTLNQTANAYYHQDFGKQLPKLKVKPTTLGYLLNYAGVHGYYNPLTGEGQFNDGLPDFMHPFIVTHEMAHQAGIAAEDDANLLAYLVDVQSPNPAFRYSGYFNIFLYAYINLKSTDSTKSRQVWQALNKKSRNDYDSLVTLYHRYRSVFRGISNDVYDSYLKWNGQKKGLRSYDVVTKWVYYWEFIDKEKADLIICPSE